MSFGRYNADFGKGFYTSTQKDTAMWSAQRLYDTVDIVTFRIPNNRLNQLDNLTFDSPSNDWADFVLFHKTKEPQNLIHGGQLYDSVTGPLFRRFDSSGNSLTWENRTQTSIHNQEIVNLFNKNIR